MNRATQLTLFSAGLMLSAIFILYFLLISDLGVGVMHYSHLILFVLTAMTAYIVCSMIIDQVLNPIRLMISKVREIGEMNFAKPLVIDDDDDELREYAFQFNNMAQKLNQFIERQKRFVSDASHELATPITIINGHADLILRHGNTNPELLEKGLTTIKQEIMHMNELVESLLALARNDSGHERYNFGETNISLLLQESIEEMQITVPEFSFKLDAPQNLIALCDEFAIRRVMRILLSNAVRYAEKIKHVEIGASQKPGCVEIYVKDSGIGIPPEHLTKIFERFYRVDASRSKKTGSSGLGLAIAKEIITAHNGDIKAQSKPNEGAEMRFTISS
jgi:signal transduction histidine kinase